MTENKSIKNYFTKFEILLWSLSVVLIISSFFLFGKNNILTSVSALIGVTSLILSAKGNPAGQILMIVFSVLYGVISYTFCYYGEMITYLCMTAPMALFSTVSWLKNPYNGNKSEVKVNRMKTAELIFAAALTLIITAVFYYILSALNTPNIIPSTLSVTTSFLAVYLTFRRSEFYAIAYAANDIILILLWIIASESNRSYLTVIICFAVFLINDIYGFISWRRMQLRQNAAQ